MARIAVLFAITCSLLLGAASGEPPTFPAAPEGFEWQWCDEGGVGKLRPAKWHFRHMVIDGTQSYFITKDKFNPPEHFLTGLTINVFSGVGKKHGGTAFAQAVVLLRDVTRDKAVVILEIPPAHVGPAKTIGCRVAKLGSIVHYFLIADDQADKLYLFYFEAPKEEWETEWKVGDEILKRLQITVLAR